MGKLDRLVWAAQSTFRVDDLYLGVRSTDAAFHQVIEQALAAHLVADLEAPPNYSVHIGHRRNRDSVAGLHAVYEGAGLASRTRDARRAVHALFNHLAARRGKVPEGLLSLSATVLVGDGVAVLAPVAVRAWRADIERRLLASGLRIVDSPSVYVDPASFEVVLSEPALDIAWPALDILEEHFPGGGPADAPAPPGRYRLVGWGMLVEGRDTGPLDPASAVARAVESVDHLPESGARSLLESVAFLTRRVRPVAIPWQPPSAIVRSLASLKVGTR